MHDTEMSTVPDGLVDTPPVPKPQGVGLAPIVEEVHHRAADLATFSASPGMLGAGPQGVAPIGGQESASLPLPYMGSDTALSPPKIGSGPSKGESETRPGQIPSYTTGTAMYSQTLFPNLLDGLAEERKELAL